MEICKLISKLVYLSSIAQVASPADYKRYPPILQQDIELIMKKLDFDIYNRNSDIGLALQFFSDEPHIIGEQIIDFSDHIDTVNRLMYVEETEPFKSFIEITGRK